MKRMAENEVLHLGQTIAAWRVIVGCIRNTEKVGLLPGERDELRQLAASIESHLPSSEQPR